MKICYDCKGNGYKIVNKMIGPGMIQRIQSYCPTCNGNKKIADSKCNPCNGEGKINVEKNYILVIEPGCHGNEDKIFKNDGDENIDGEASDVIFILKEEKNNTFNRIGNDLIYIQTITLGDSIVGIDTNITLINGEILSYKENNIIQNNSYSIFKNKGFPIKNKPNSYGDLYIVYNIKYPNKVLNENEKDIIKNILEVSDKNNESNNYNTNGVLRNNFSINDIKKKYEQKDYHNMNNIFNKFF